MKVRIWYVIEDGGDGSAHPIFFKSKQEMEAYIKEQEDSEYEFIDLSEGGSYEDIEAEQYEWIE